MNATAALPLTVSPPVNGFTRLPVPNCRRGAKAAVSNPDTTSPPVPVTVLPFWTPTVAPRWTYPVAAPKSRVGPLNANAPFTPPAANTVPLDTVRVPVPVTDPTPPAVAVLDRAFTRQAPLTVALPVRLTFLYWVVASKAAPAPPSWYTLAAVVGPTYRNPAAGS